MIRLYLAIPDGTRPDREAFLDERTAGTWRRHIKLVELHAAPGAKAYNNGELERLSSAQPGSQIYAVKSCTTGQLSSGYPNVKRFSSAEFDRQTVEWLDRNLIAWRAKVDDCRKKGSYIWMDPAHWCAQFHKVDSDRGLRVASAILAQLRIATAGEMADWFDGLKAVDLSAVFIGSDPHSGDHSLVNVLSTRIPGNSLAEAHKLPAMKAKSTFRLFNDGGWSGGESERRLECLYRACDKKPNSLPADASLDMRFGFLTNVALARITAKVDSLKAEGMIQGHVDITYPAENILHVGQEPANGLAFQDPEILRYVDPNDSGAMKDLCHKIGLQISKSRPLGTGGVASTLGFEHSLPRAMLPVLIFGKAKVEAEDGTKFEWMPLVHSRHVSDPAQDDKGYYCGECPFTRRKPVASAQVELNVHRGP